MKRRALLQLLGATATTSAAWPLRLNAQQRSQPALVGIFGSREGVPVERDAFHRGMRDLGYVEGRDISYTYPTLSDSLPLRLAAAALEFVRQKPEVIVSGGGVANVRALMEVTSTIPIVMVPGTTQSKPGW